MFFSVVAFLLGATLHASMPKSDYVSERSVRLNGPTATTLDDTDDVASSRPKRRRPAYFALDANELDIENTGQSIVDQRFTSTIERDGSNGFHLLSTGEADNNGDDVVLIGLSASSARVTYAGYFESALTPDSAEPRAKPLTPGPVAANAIGGHWPTNAEMTAIYDADQADRQPGPKIDWTKVWPRDAARRARTKALLDAGKLNSGTDFVHAAFVFQHGSGNDFLLAHVLATIAIARGRPDATWIAAATLDRYLQSVGQPQVYGTQYTVREGKATQEPYDRSLISDALRVATGVPPQAAQEIRRQAYERDARAAGSR